MLIVLIFKLFVIFNVVCVAYGATNLDADPVEPHYNLRTRDKRAHSLHEESTTSSATSAITATKRVRTSKKKLALTLTRSEIDNDFEVIIGNSKKASALKKLSFSKASLRLAKRVQAILPSTEINELAHILDRTGKHYLLSNAVFQNALFNYEKALVDTKKFLQEKSEPPFPLIGLTASKGTKTYERQLLSRRRSAVQYYMSDKKFKVLSAVHMLTERSNHF